MEYIITPTVNTETITKAEEENISANENINLMKGFLSKDSLKRLKAIIIVGPVEEDTKQFIDEQKKHAAYLRNLGVQVLEFYHPKAKQKDIVAASKGANIVIYAGHGMVSLFCLTNGLVNSEDLLKEMNLQKNALVIFNHACESAGSSGPDMNDIGQSVAVNRVTEYAKPFVQSNVAAYYANNYNDNLISFFISLFERKKLKDIYTDEATKRSKLEYRNVYSYNPNYEIGLASSRPTNQMITYNWYTNGKITKTQKVKDFKSYDVAYVGKPNFTVIDLFR
jgi:hypothetical protein